MRLLIAFISCFLLVGCVNYIDLTTMTHDFQHHGTDPLMTDSDFFYVRQNVTGSSIITYNFDKYGKLIGGGDVKKGQIADAKGALAINHPLQPNQAYINMSIDITEAIRTQHFRGANGIVSENGTIQKITYHTTVSADIIEYGESPLTKEFNKHNNDSG